MSDSKSNRNSGRLTLGYILIMLLSLFLWIRFFPQQYYVMVLLILFASFLFWILHFESKKLDSRELALIAALTSLAVAGRALFFFVPQIKPTAAIVILCGIALGKAAGFSIGLLSMFLSNFLFGQSMNTPFQMIAMALLGFLAAFIPESKKENKALVGIVAFLLTFIVYGLTVDAGSALLLSIYQGKVALFAIFLAGVPFNLVHALSTSVFILVISPFLIPQLRRVSLKYGLFEHSMVK